MSSLFAFLVTTRTKFTLSQSPAGRLHLCCWKPTIAGAGQDVSLFQEKAELRAQRLHGPSRHISCQNLRRACAREESSGGTVRASGSCTRQRAARPPPPLPQPWSHSCKLLCFASPKKQQALLSHYMYFRFKKQ